MAAFLVLFSTLLFIASHAGNTTVSIDGTNFKINGELTYPKSKYDSVKGLLLNSRMIQGVFDDANQSTVHLWDYPDTHKWDPLRNTNEFVGNMSLWNSYGLLSFTVGLQGGGPDSPYPNPQPWIVSAYDFKTGALDSKYMDRLDMILAKADQLAMVPIVQFFYWGQAERFNKNNKVINDSINNIVDHLLATKYSNLLIDVANECTGGNYDGTILKCDDNMTTTITDIKGYIKTKTGKDNGDLGIYIGSSVNSPPNDNMIAASDFVLMHGNGKSPSDMQDMINTVKDSKSYKSKPKPIVYNEDPHENYNDATNNMEVAVTNHASWGYYDQGNNNYQDGYQSPPTAWDINTSDKKQFFDQVKKYSGY